MGTLESESSPPPSKLPLQYRKTRLRRYPSSPSYYALLGNDDNIDGVSDASDPKPPMTRKRSQREPSFSLELERGISKFKKLGLYSTLKFGGDGMAPGRREKLKVEFHSGGNPEKKEVDIVVKGIMEKKNVMEEKIEKSPSPEATDRTIVSPAQGIIAEAGEDSDDEVTSPSPCSGEVQKLNLSRLHS